MYFPIKSIALKSFQFQPRSLTHTRAQTTEMVNNALYVNVITARVNCGVVHQLFLYANLIKFQWRHIQLENGWEFTIHKSNIEPHSIVGINVV